MSSGFWLLEMLSLWSFAIALSLFLDVVYMSGILMTSLALVPAQTMMVIGAYMLTLTASFTVASTSLSWFKLG